MTEITKLIKVYEQQEPVKELAQKFGIHRSTVTAILERSGVERRRLGSARSGKTARKQS
jgi:hypothetical protein